MGLAALEYKARFALHLRCDNCMRESVLALDIPQVDFAPSDIEELAEDAALNSLRYHCRHCSCTVGRIIRITEGHSHAQF